MRFLRSIWRSPPAPAPQEPPQPLSRRVAPPFPTGEDQVLTRHQRDLVAKDRCPRCQVGALDTGWECTRCGYDAMWIAAAPEARA